MTFLLRRGQGMKIILWIIAIIFIVGLLTITGVFKLIFWSKADRVWLHCFKTRGQRQAGPVLFGSRSSPADLKDAFSADWSQVSCAFRRLWQTAQTAPCRSSLLSTDVVNLNLVLPHLPHLSIFITSTLPELHWIRIILSKIPQRSINNIY